MSELSIFNYKRYYRDCFINRILFPFRTIKYIFQRACKGYCDLDLHGLNDFFINLIPNSIEQFASETYSCPDDIAEKEWETYLLKIVTLLRESKEGAINKDYLLHKLCNDEMKKKALETENRKILHDKKRNLAFKMLAMRFNDLWD